MQPTVLITGFESFGGETLNPTQQILGKVEGLCFVNHKVITKLLPTVFGASSKALLASVAELRPSLVLCLGQAGGRSSINVEAVALNLDDAQIPDNSGNKPQARHIEQDGPVAYWATLPTRQVHAALNDAGIPAVLSYSAGTFVCNHVFYNLMHYLSVKGSPVPAGFVHVPYLPKQAVRHRGAPSMSLDLMVRAVKIIVETGLGVAKK